MGERNVWPQQGTTDWVAGPSRLESDTTPADMVIDGSYQKLKDITATYEAGLTQAMIEYCINGPKTDEEETVDEEAQGGTSAKGLAVVEEARKYVDRSPYHWGGNGPGGCSHDKSKKPLGGYDHGPGKEYTECFDCSGLVRWAYKQAGFSIKDRTSSAMHASSQGEWVKKGKLDSAEAIDLPAPGDVIFFGSPVHHVALCVGDRTGQMIEAPGTGKLVRVSNIAKRHDINGVKRYFPIEAMSSVTGAQYKGIKNVEVLFTTYCPGYGDPSMQGDNTMATGAKIELSPNAPLGYKVTYRSKVYYYACAVKFKGASGDKPLVLDARYDYLPGDKSPAKGYVFSGDPTACFVALDVYAVDWRGKTLAPNSIDILCAPTHKAALDRIIGPSRIGSGNNGYGAATRANATIVDRSQPVTTTPSTSSGTHRNIPVE